MDEDLKKCPACGNERYQFNGNRRICLDCDSFCICEHSADSHFGGKGRCSHQDLAPRPGACRCTEFLKIPAAIPKYHRHACRCGHVTEGVRVFRDHWVLIMSHTVGECPLVSRAHARRIMAMISRDNLGEFEAD